MMAERRKDQIKVAIFMTGDANYHSAGWRLPDAYADVGTSLEHWIEFAKTMERGKLDMLFLADGIGTHGIDNLEGTRHNPKLDRMEPFTLLGALASVTTHLGLAATAHTAYNEPYHIARKFASLDHLSGGRTGWNIVTGANAEDALNFSRERHAPIAERYDMAEEFTDVCIGLWDSYEDGAFLRDQESGVYVDTDKLHVLNHKGKYFQVKGPLSLARPPQGHPVLIQAGMSEPARELSARVADAVFTSQPTIEEAKAFYQDVKARTAKYGRNPDDLKVLAGVVLFTGKTADEAEEKYDHLFSLTNMTASLSLVGQRLGGIDLTKYPLDEPVPDFQGNDVRASNAPLAARMARRENLTLRGLIKRYTAGGPHALMKGTPKQVADELEQWFVEGAADGFIFMPVSVPHALDDIVDLLIPELQRRGLFRTEYEGKTLRENLGVARPENTFLVKARN